MVDDRATPGETFCVPLDHPCLPGHFPDRPLVPGVVILDHVLDAIERGNGPVGAGLRLPQVKFVQSLLPGETATVMLEAMGSGRWRFRVLRGDTLIATGEAVVA